MSLYNMTLGTHPWAGNLLHILSIDPQNCGRLRDVYLQEIDDKLRIVVFTRNGGGNREDHEEVFERLRPHPFYVKDFDEPYDNTYASIVFEIPDEHRADIDGAIEELMREKSVPRERLVYPPFKERFKKMLAAMGPTVEKAP